MTDKYVVVREDRTDGMSPSRVEKLPDAQTSRFETQAELTSLSRSETSRSMTSDIAADLIQDEITHPSIKPSELEERLGDPVELPDEIRAKLERSRSSAKAQKTAKAELARALLLNNVHHAIIGVLEAVYGCTTEQAFELAGCIPVDVIIEKASGRRDMAEGLLASLGFLPDVTFQGWVESKSIATDGPAIPPIVW